MYFSGAVLGGFVYLDLHFNDAYPVVGASAAVLALLTFFCLLRPEQPITLLLFFVLPVTLKPKWIFWGTLGISALGVLTSELPNVAGSGAAHTRVAHSAHLGGMIAGILFYRYLYQGQRPAGPRLPQARQAGNPAAPVRSRPRGSSAARKPPARWSSASTAAVANSCNRKSTASSTKSTPPASAR